MTTMISKYELKNRLFFFGYKASKKR